MDLPTHLGRYQIVRVLGRGAMGLVYEGLDPRLGRRVAIKVISTSHLGDATVHREYSARFVNEAQAVARLNHPHIVTVHDFGEEEGAAYLVMELIAGDELATWFDDSAEFQLEIGVEDAVRMTAELLDALGYAHAHGIVHRDVKPANVMVSRDLRVKLTDFGIARMADVQVDEEGALIGTPSCMSPEQICGQPAGPRSDLFSCALILYKFLTGQRAFPGNGMFAIQQKILYDEPLPPSLLNPDLSPMFDRVLARALAKRAQDRYPDAASFAADLRRALQGDEVAPLEFGADELAPEPAAPAAPAGDPDATMPHSAADPDATRLHLP
jgi:serine/threonine protein kinase